MILEYLKVKQLYSFLTNLLSLVATFSFISFSCHSYKVKNIIIELTLFQRVMDEFYLLINNVCNESRQI